MSAWDYLERLARLPTRGSATAGEQTAARWLQEQLESLGYHVEMQPFRSPRHTLYIGPTAVIVVLLGALWLSESMPVAATVLAAAAFVPLVGEMLGAPVNFNLILPKSPSQNVVARPARPARPARSADGTESSPEMESGTDTGMEPGTGTDMGPRTDTGTKAGTGTPNVVIVAHYDTQWGSWLFAPGFRRLLQPFFIVTYAGLVLAFVAVCSRWIVPGAPWTDYLASTAVVLLVTTGAVFFFSWLTGRPVPGANDNGSGVAVALGLAARWMEHMRAQVQGQAQDTAQDQAQDTAQDQAQDQDQDRDQETGRVSMQERGATSISFRPLFVFTGCEEVGLRGMHRFLADAELPRDTVFINLDNVGGGRLRYFLGEGMLAYQPYDAELLQIAQAVSERHGGHVTPLKNWLLPTDGLLPAKAGFRAISFLAMNDDQSIPQYHWHTDTLENVDRGVVEFTERFIWDYVQAVDDQSRIA